MPDRLCQPLRRQIHITEQKRVLEVVKVGSEEGLGFRARGDTPVGHNLRGCAAHPAGTAYLFD
jgi:hypothetical protein